MSVTMHIKEAIKGLLEGKGLNESLEDLLETDREERDLERRGDSEALFKLSRKKLRRARHLGRLSDTSWKTLIDGAKLHGHHVYLAVGRGPHVSLYKMVSPELHSRVAFLSKMEFKDGTGYPLNFNIWMANSFGWQDINRSITKSSRLTLSKTDYTKYSDGNTIVKELGIEDVFH